MSTPTSAPAPTPVITPTVGRTVLYHPATTMIPHVPGEPLAAKIVRVWPDGVTVNLCVFDVNGTPWGRTGVPLVQGSEVVPAAHRAVGSNGYCTWMDWQVEQKAKENAETAAASGAAG